MGLLGKAGRFSAALAAATAVSATAVVISGGAPSGAVSGAGGAAATAAAQAPQSNVTCVLGNGVKHVVEITFDNVHFNRDNPNVPSDLEMMPNLLDFIEGHGTLLSNNHTPLIAHTADDTLTTFTGLYGDRQGMGISNSFQTYNPNGTTDPASSFAYWTDPIYDTASKPTPGHDTHPSMVYSPVPPATASPPVSPNKIAPAPWVPFTRAGCNVGEVATTNMELENTNVDIPKVFGPHSPEAKQLAADPDPYKDPEAADYNGIGVHCAAGASFCADAEAVKYGEKHKTHTEVPDLLPTEPGGYKGFDALFGHRYVAPQMGAGKTNLRHHGFPVTNSKGNLVDLFGNEIDGAFTNNQPGFPGFGGINAAQTLAYMADMQESGVPVTFGYIADIHGNANIPGLTACNNAPSALGSGSACYIEQAQYYNEAFGLFFKRLYSDGITPKNSLFIFSADEGDHEAGANVGRAIQPSPANCDGAVVSGLVVTPDVECTYPAGSFGELDGNITGLLATQKGDTTPFSLEDDTAPEFYVTGDPAYDNPAVRQLERDAGSVTASNPYAGGTQTVDNYLADRTEMAILHMVDADPARTPTFAMFAKPDYYLSSGPASCSGSCVTQNDSYAWDHGDYAAEINNNWLGIVGPGVANLGLDGSDASQGPNSAGPNSGQENDVQQAQANSGTWIDETDIRPTLMFLAGLKDDYTEDGRVITEVLTSVPATLAAKGVDALATCYKQVNASTGSFGTYTLQAATAAMKSSSSNDSTYLQTVVALSELEHARDFLTNQIKHQLWGAEFAGRAITPGHVSNETAFCQYLISQAQYLAGNTGAVERATRVVADVGSARRLRGEGELAGGVGPALLPPGSGAGSQPREARISDSCSADMIPVCSL